MTGSSFVYVTYIRTTPDKLWSALTTPEFIKKYWFNITHETDWKVGSPWKMRFPDGRVADTGEILAFDPPKRLAFKWRNEFRPELKAEGWSQCVMDIEPEGDAVKLTGDPHDRGGESQVHRGGLRRLAEDPFQPQISAGNR